MPDVTITLPDDQARAVWHTIGMAVDLIDQLGADTIPADAPLHGRRDQLVAIGRRLDHEINHAADDRRGPGAAMIAFERARQIAEEGWTAEHDHEHGDAALLSAGIAYSIRAWASLSPTCGWNTTMTDDVVLDQWWPWDERDYKPGTPITNLVKAGALIAAEIDRHQDAGGYAVPPTQPKPTPGDPKPGRRYEALAVSARFGSSGGDVLLAIRKHPNPEVRRVIALTPAEARWLYDEGRLSGWTPLPDKGRAKGRDGSPTGGAVEDGDPLEALAPDRVWADVWIDDDTGTEHVDLNTDGPRGPGGGSDYLTVEYVRRTAMLEPDKLLAAAQEFSASEPAVKAMAAALAGLSSYRVVDESETLEDACGLFSAAMLAVDAAERSMLANICEVLDRGIPDDRKLAVLWRIVNHREPLVQGDADA